MGWGQEEFPGGLKNQAKERISAMKVITEKWFFSKRGVTLSARREKNLYAKKCLLHQGTCKVAISFMRILSTPGVIHILIHKSLKCTQKPWT